MEYLSASEMGKRWNLSRRRVSVLCSEGRIPGAQKIGGNWMIPADAESDAAIAAAKSNASVAAALEGKQIIKEIYVKGRLVNIVAK